MFLIFNTLVSNGFIVIGPSLETGNPKGHPTSVPTANTPVSPPSPITSLCPDTVPRTMVSAWGIGAINVNDVQPYLDRYETYRKNGGGFIQGNSIPSGVVIATDFGNGESEIWQTYPVKPIVHYHSWGLFEVIDDFSASSPGSCVTITP
jgi:hypothetical protein